MVDVFDLNVAVSLVAKDLALPHPNVLCHLQFINRAINPEASHSCSVVRFAHDVDIRCWSGCGVVGWGFFGVARWFATVFVRSNPHFGSEIFEKVSV